MTLSLEDASRIGGSDLAALLGRSPWGTPFTIYARIVSALEGRAMPHEDSASKRRGRVLEKAVLNLYAEETGARLLPGPKLGHPRLKYVRASLDALADRDGLRVVDAKTAGLSEVRKWGEAGTDEVPEYMLYQLAFYSGIAWDAGRVADPMADIAALVGGDLRVYHVPHDPDLYRMLEQAVERFWVDHVEPRRPPPMTDPMVELPSIGALYPKHEGEAKAWDSLAGVEQSEIVTWLRCRAERKKFEAMEKEAEARVRMLLGTTPSLTLPDEIGGGRVDWRQNRPSRVTDWERIVRDVLPAYVSLEQYTEIIKANTTTKEGARPLVVRQREET
jgi:predicted phage-related endonuclease